MRVRTGIALLLTAAGVAAGTATASANPRPHALTVSLPSIVLSVIGSPNGSTLYASTYPPGGAQTDGFLVVLDAATGAVTANVAVGSAGRLEMSHDGSRILVDGPGAPVIATATNSVVAHLSFTGTDVVLSTDGTRAYVTSANTGRVTALDVATSQILSEVTVGRMTGSIAINPAGDRLFVEFTDPAQADSDGIAALSVEPLAVVGKAIVHRVSDCRTGATTSSGEPACLEQPITDCLVVSPTGDRLYSVASSVAAVRGLTAFDTTTLAQVGRLDLGGAPGCPRLSGDGRLALLANPDLQYIDTPTMALKGIAAVSGHLGPLAPEGTAAWLFDGQTLEGIDVATSVRPAAPITWAGTTVQFAQQRGVISVSQRMAAMLRKPFNGTYFDGSHRIRVIHRSGVTRQADATTGTVTYDFGRTTCSRQASRAHPDTLTADRRATWTCRRSRPADDVVGSLGSLLPGPLARRLAPAGSAVLAPTVAVLAPKPTELNFQIYANAQSQQDPVASGGYSVHGRTLTAAWREWGNGPARSLDLTGATRPVLPPQGAIDR